VRTSTGKSTAKSRYIAPIHKIALHRSHDGSMRARIVRVAVTAVAVALVLFAIPLAITVRSAFLTQERGELERAALSAALRVGPEFASGDGVELPRAEGDKDVGVYDRTFRLRAGRGPRTADEITVRAAGAVVADGQVGSDLVVAVPVSFAEDVVGVVRASVATRVVWQRVILAWLLLAGVAIGCLLAAILVARRQARSISEPLEALSAASQRVADGDVTARAELSGIPEIHRVAQTHNTMVSQLATVIDKERHFSANASHQLRTPLTGLELSLEAALQHPAADLPAVLSDALRQVRELHRTVDDVLALARLGPNEWLNGTPRPLDRLMAELERRWHGELAAESRRLVVNLDPEAAGTDVSANLLTQVLNVLLDNALRHGRGTVTVTVREIGGALAVDVADEGSLAMATADLFERGRSGSEGEGIGLALARSMAEASGARLLLAHRSPTTFSLFLPVDISQPDLPPS
jgi:signal transduction histidine kinase